jgi:hypothetical protein
MGSTNFFLTDKGMTGLVEAKRVRSSFPNSELRVDKISIRPPQSHHNPGLDQPDPSIDTSQLSRVEFAETSHPSNKIG